MSETVNRTVPLLKFREDTTNFWRALTAIFIFILPAITGMPTGLWGCTYGLLLWFLLCDMNFVLHQHVHYPMTRSRPWNLLLDLLLSCVTGMSAYSWRQHHLLHHHRGDDRWGKHFAWEWRRHSAGGALSYSLRQAMIIFFKPLIEAFTKGVMRHQQEPIDFRASFIQQVGILAIMVLVTAKTPEFYIPYYCLVYIFTTIADYDTHAGCDEGHWGAANNTLSPSYNWVRNNFGFHTAHHIHPDAHWTELPAFHDQIAAHILPRHLSNRWWTGAISPMLVVWWTMRLLRST